MREQAQAYERELYDAAVEATLGVIGTPTHGDVHRAFNQGARFGWRAYASQPITDEAVEAFIEAHGPGCICDYLHELKVRPALEAAMKVRGGQGE